MSHHIHISALASCRYIACDREVVHNTRSLESFQYSHFPPWKMSKTAFFTGVLALLLLLLENSVSIAGQTHLSLSVGYFAFCLYLCLVSVVTKRNLHENIHLLFRHEEEVTEIVVKGITTELSFETIPLLQGQFVFVRRVNLKLPNHYSTQLILV